MLLFVFNWTGVHKTWPSELIALLMQAAIPPPLPPQPHFWLLRGGVAWVRSEHNYQIKNFITVILLMLVVVLMNIQTRSMTSPVILLPHDGKLIHTLAYEDCFGNGSFTPMSHLKKVRILLCVFFPLWREPLKGLHLGFQLIDRKNHASVLNNGLNSSWHHKIK